MSILTLSERLYGIHFEEARQALLSILRDALKGLDAHPKILGVTKTGWAMVELKGSDGEAAENLLKRIVGTVPRALSELKDRTECRGRILELKEELGILVNVGIEEPDIYDALISLSSLRKQLADGRRLGVRDLANLYGLHEGIPLEVRIFPHRIEAIRKVLEAELTDRQLDAIFQWRRLGLDRVLVVGVTTGTVRKALKATGCERYILRIERLGVLENALLCKLGTEAPGILHTLAKALPNARLYPLRGGWNLNRYR
ncbi:MAG: DUF2110 family protein [Candidatus Bathyarchaeia archaeon]